MLEGKVTYSRSKLHLMFTARSSTRLKSPDPVRTAEANSSMERHCEALIGWDWT